MKKEDIVLSIEFAQKMEKLGFKQESLFVWIWSWMKQDFVLEYDDKVNNKETGGLLYGARTCYSAYTVAELGEMLPVRHCYTIRDGLNDDRFVCKWTEKAIWGNTEANARAKMLIYLKEKGLI